MIGFGVYPNATINDFNKNTPLKDILDLTPVHSGPILIMGYDGKQNHDVALQFHAQGFTTIRRAFVDDNKQIVYPNPLPYPYAVLRNVTNWIAAILGGLSIEEFKLRYDYVVGFNENYAQSDVANWPFLIEIELGICKYFQAQGIKYICGSIAVGNVETSNLILFKNLFNIADGLNYHGYLAPGSQNLDTSPDYINRPLEWFKYCRANNIKFPPLLLGETGTFYSWKDMHLDTKTYSNILAKIDGLLTSWKIPIIGNCMFAIGAEGDMGVHWNVEDLDYVKKYNSNIKSFSGVGAWTWYDGKKALESGLDHHIVKYSDGNTHGDAADHEVFRRNFLSLVGSLHQKNRQVYAYAYIYLDDPVGEAKAIATSIADGADGIVLDVEYETVNKLHQMQVFFDTLMPLVPMNVLLMFAPDFRILIGNQRLPWNIDKLNINAEPFPWSILLRYCSVVMPQLYYTDFQVSPVQVFDLIGIFKFASTKYDWSECTISPIIPADTTGPDLLEFLSLCTKNDIKNVSVWRLDNCPAAYFEILRNWRDNTLNPDVLAVIGEQIFFVGAGVPFNPKAAITKAWVKGLTEGHYLGRPRGKEFIAGVYTCQEFEYNLGWWNSVTGNYGYGVPN